MGTCPTKTCHITPHGGYAFYRANRDVTHYAWDLGGAGGTPVVSPEAGVVDTIASGQSAPWSGYDPGLVVVRGRSGYYHLLAHLNPDTIKVRVGEVVQQGQQVGSVAYDHVHWEVRKKRLPEYAKFARTDQAHRANTVNPRFWLFFSGVGGAVVLAGIGYGVYRYLRRG